MNSGRIRAGVAAVLVLVPVVLGGCDQAGELVDDARGRADDLIGVAEDVREQFTWCASAARLGQAVIEQDAEAARDAAADLRIGAPAVLQEDLLTIVDGLGRVEGEGRAVLREAGVEAAARGIVDTAVDQCGTDDGG